MRDVSRKIVTLRTATARATIRLAPETVKIVLDRRVPKGDPLEVSRVAAVQAAKNTSQTIPYCHPVPVDAVDIDFTVAENHIDVQATVTAVCKTGVEMEALTAAAVAALNLYDMLKALDDSMEIQDIRLLRKKGGKSDFGEAFDSPLRAVVLVISDSIAAGEKDDRSGRIIAERLKAEGLEVAGHKVVPDKQQVIEQELIDFADARHLDLVLTTGGTGCGPRDRTPEAMDNIIEREVPGIAEAARAYGQERTPYSMLSRGRAGFRGKTLIVNLPGSPKGVFESLDALFPGILHVFKMLRGEGHSSETADGEEVSR